MHANTTGASNLAPLDHASDTAGFGSDEYRLGNSRDHASTLGSEERPRIRIALPPNAADDLRCLFFHGPTWDGNVPSKSGRDELVRMGLAARGNGWQWLTPAGIQACFDNGIHHEKEKRDAIDRRRRGHAIELAHAVLGTASTIGGGCGFDPQGEG